MVQEILTFGTLVLNEKSTLEILTDQVTAALLVICKELTDVAEVALLFSNALLGKLVCKLLLLEELVAILGRLLLGTGLLVFKLSGDPKVRHRLYGS